MLSELIIMARIIKRICMLLTYLCNLFIIIVQLRDFEWLTKIKSSAQKNFEM